MKSLNTVKRYMRKSNEYYIEKILADLDFITEHTEGITQEMLEASPVLCDSMMFRLIQVSENAGCLSEEYKAKHSDVPWLKINGLRNRIVHDYGNVKLKIVYDTINEDVPKLKEMLKA